jgi:hypothetical protein
VFSAIRRPQEARDGSRRKVARGRLSKDGYIKHHWHHRVSAPYSNICRLSRVSLLHFPRNSIAAPAQPTMFTKPLATACVLLTLVAQAFSQAGFWVLPTCQQVCIVRMLNEDINFGCPPHPDHFPDISCLCTGANATNFSYGIRDCILQSCEPVWSFDYEVAYQQICGKYGSN